LLDGFRNWLRGSWYLVCPLLGVTSVSAFGACTNPPIALPDPPEGAAEAALVSPAADAFVRVRGQHFTLGGRPLFVVGFNYWSAAADAASAGGRARAARELDRLAGLGVRVLRVMLLSEGPDGEPWRMRPSLQPEAGRFDAAGLAGLDWLVAALAERGMSGVFVLNNFWFWSGGMPQYLSWARGVSIPYPNLESGAGWDSYERYTAEFYSDARARLLFEGALETVVPRYRDSPAVFAWELANEPHAPHGAAAYRAWLDETARFVRRLDPNHCITTGSEGNTPSPEQNGLDAVLDHSSPAIDFVSFHLWPENWGWTGGPSAELDAVIARAQRYIDDHVAAAERLGKPALLLETGLPRDGGSFEPSAAVTRRDRYLEHVLSATLASATQGGALAGVFPWAWSGELRPEAPGRIANQAPALGDPPHERQGWYGIYTSDTSTLALVSRYAADIRAASP
jgi:mannan endo-1,4-beta-mannosidase